MQGVLLCCCCAFPDLSVFPAPNAGFDDADHSLLSRLHRPKTKPVILMRSHHLFSLSGSIAPGLIRRLWCRPFKCRLVTGVKPSDEDNVENGDEAVQNLLVDLLRLEAEKVRVNEFVEDRSKFLTGLAEQANEEFERITEDAKKCMDEAGSKVLEQIDAEAAGFEESLAAARAEMEANEQDLEEFEESVRQARSEGLYFKSLYNKSNNPLGFQSRKQNESREVDIVLEQLNQAKKRALGSKYRLAGYAGMIILVTLCLLEAIISENFQWTKVVVYSILLVALLVQLSYERTISTKSKEKDMK